MPSQPIFYTLFHAVKKKHCYKKNFCFRDHSLYTERLATPPSSLKTSLQVRVCSQGLLFAPHPRSPPGSKGSLGPAVVAGVTPAFTGHAAKQIIKSFQSKRQNTLLLL